MTVNEMIIELQKIADCGYGDYFVTTSELDAVSSVEENPYKKGFVTVWAEN